MHRIILVFSLQTILCCCLATCLATKECHTGTGRCYWLGNGTYGREKAESECQDLHGNLAVIETEELWNFVFSTLSSLPPNMYIGLSDEAQEGIFRWLNNAPLHYERWKSGKPTTNTARNCVVVKDGKWNERRCPDKLPFLCSSPAPRCREEKDGCSSTITAHMGKIFGTFGPSNWHSAKSTCEGQGRKLLTIDSQAEEIFAALADPGDRFWLGVSDLDVHSVYRTVDGYIPPWSNWFDGEPSFRSKVGDENCVKRFERNYDGKWDDSKCSYPTMFYCERKFKRCIYFGEEGAQNKKCIYECDVTDAFAMEIQIIPNVIGGAICEIDAQ